MMQRWPDDDLKSVLSDFNESERHADWNILIAQSRLSKSINALRGCFEQAELSVEDQAQRRLTSANTFGPGKHSPMLAFARTINDAKAEVDQQDILRSLLLYYEFQQQSSCFSPQPCYSSGKSASRPIDNGPSSAVLDSKNSRESWLTEIPQFLQDTGRQPDHGRAQERHSDPRDFEECGSISEHQVGGYHSHERC